MIRKYFTTGQLEGKLAKQPLLTRLAARVEQMKGRYDTYEEIKPVVRVSKAVGLILAIRAKTEKKQAAMEDSKVTRAVLHSHIKQDIRLLTFDERTTHGLGIVKTFLLVGPLPQAFAAVDLAVSYARLAILPKGNK
ncbi:MAG: hypothetical protein WCT31_03685 [Candidatus Micrarchaeia archaeon]